MEAAVEVALVVMGGDPSAVVSWKRVESRASHFPENELAISSFPFAS